MASIKKEGKIEHAIKHPVDTVLTNKPAEQHRRINTALAGVGTAAGLLTATRMLRQRPTEQVVKATKATTRAANQATKTARDAQAAINESPLNRSSRAKAVRKNKAKRVKRAKEYLNKKRSSKWSKWRKTLNKLPGGKRFIFENSIQQRIFEKNKAKTIAFAISRPELDDSSAEKLRAMRQSHNKVKRQVRTARKGVDAIRDIQDMIKGERRNKRRKRFYEKQAFKDNATSAAIAGGGLGIAALANSKRGRALIKRLFSEGHIEEDKMIELMEGPQILTDEAKRKGWRMSRPTSQSVRVHHKGDRRNRRKKHWHERKSSRDKFLGTAIMGAVGTAGLSALLGRRLKRITQNRDAYKKAYNRIKGKPKGIHVVRKPDGRTKPPRYQNN